MIDDARLALDDSSRGTTPVADKGCDVAEIIEAYKAVNITPHVAPNRSGRQSTVPESIAQSAGYRVMQQKRKLVEQGFGWADCIDGMRHLPVRGLKKVDQMFVLTMAAYNLVRMRTLGRFPALRLQ